MDSRTTIMQRPMGPRSRGPPSSLATSNNQPRDQQRLPVPALTVPHEPARSPKPSLSSLTIPRPPLSKPSFPKIKIEINTGSAPGPLFESYYGGPNGPSLDINTPPEDKTIRPESTATCVPQPNQRSTEPFTDIRELVTELEGRPSQPPVLPDPLAEDDDAVLIPTPPTLSWSDDVLEEQSRLGEGAGGAVHKVKDKRTGKVMARKTITTREAPMKQLLRELSIISSTEHINIVLFHGAFMSPSSSEVKILMEYCEGGSLEAVGKRIKERGAVVGEKIAGRLAEGVGANFDELLSPEL
jgi:mitogen-activated protein kinase kinase